MEEKEEWTWAHVVPCNEQNRIMHVGLTQEEGRGSFVPVRLAAPWLRMRSIQPAYLSLDALVNMPYFKKVTSPKAGRTSREIILEITSPPEAGYTTILYMNPTAFGYFNSWLQSALGQRFRRAVDGEVMDISAPFPKAFGGTAFLNQLLLEMQDPARPVDTQIGPVNPPDPTNKNEPS